MTPNQALTVARIRRMLASGEARRQREAAGISQTETSEVVGVTAATVCRWESGERVPSAAHALAYAGLLDLLREEVPA